MGDDERLRRAADWTAPGRPPRPLHGLRRLARLRGRRGLPRPELDVARAAVEVRRARRRDARPAAPRRSPTGSARRPRCRCARRAPRSASSCSSRARRASPSRASCACSRASAGTSPSSCSAARPRAAPPSRPRTSRRSRRSRTSSRARPTCTRRGSTLTRAVREVTAASSVVLWEPTASGEELEVTAATGAALRGMTVSLGERSVISTVFHRGQLAFLADVPGQPAIAFRWHELTDAESGAWVPVIQDGRTVGVLLVGWNEPRARAVRARRGAAAPARLRGRDHDPPHRSRRQAAVDGAHRPADRAPEPARLGRGPRARARARPPPRRQPVPGDARPRPLQGLQRPSRPPGRRPAAGRDRHGLAPRAAHDGHDRPLRRRGVRRAAPALRRGGRAAGRRAPARLRAARPDRLRRHRRVGRHARRAQELLARADAALYDAKRAGRARALFSPSAL